MRSFLTGIGIEVNNACNLSCLHCFTRGGETSYQLSHDEIISILDQLASRLLPMTVEFSGGEPLLRRDIFDLIKHGQDQGLKMILSTNGTLVTKRVAERLRAMDVQDVAISVDGASADTHDMIRGAGSFGRTLRGISNLVEVGIRPSIRQVVMQTNIQELEDTARLGKRAGACYVLFMRFSPSGRGKDFESVLAVNQELLRSAFNRVMKMKQKPKEFGNVDVDCAFPYPSDDRDITIPLEVDRGGCPACHHVFNIRSDGYVEACPMIRGPVAGNVRTESIERIWKDGALFCLLRQMEIEECNQCEYFLRNCYGGCRGYVYQSTGTFHRFDCTCWHFKPKKHVNQRDQKKLTLEIPITERIGHKTSMVELTVPVRAYTPKSDPIRISS